MLLLFIVPLLTILRLGSAQNARDIECYINPDVEIIKLSLLTGNDSAETCFTRCQGTSANITGVKLLEGTDVPGMCACVTLRPDDYIYFFSCCKGKAKLQIASFGYRAFNISIHDKHISSDHYYSTNRNELCDATEEEIEEPIKLLDVPLYNMKEILITLTLDDQKSFVFCPNNDSDTEREVYSSLNKTFDAFFISGFQSSSKNCKQRCVSKSRFTNYRYKYFVLATDNYLNLEFCDCFPEFPVVLRSIQQCPQCHIDKSHSCSRHNVTYVVCLMESPSNRQLTSTTDGNNSTNIENGGLSVGWIVFIIGLVVICIVIVATLCHGYYKGRRGWRIMICCSYSQVPTDEGTVRFESN